MLVARSRFVATSWITPNRSTSRRLIAIYSPDNPLSPSAQRHIAILGDIGCRNGVQIYYNKTLMGSAGTTQRLSATTCNSIGSEVRDGRNPLFKIPLWRLSFLTALACSFVVTADEVSDIQKVEQALAVYMHTVDIIGNHVDDEEWQQKAVSVMNPQRVREAVIKLLSMERRLKLMHHLP